MPIAYTGEWPVFSFCDTPGSIFLFLTTLIWGGSEESYGWGGRGGDCLLHASEDRTFVYTWCEESSAHRLIDLEAETQTVNWSAAESEFEPRTICSKAHYVCVLFKFLCLKFFSLHCVLLHSSLSFSFFISVGSAYNHAQVPASPSLLFLCFLLKPLFCQSFPLLSNVWKEWSVLAGPTSSTVTN